MNNEAVSAPYTPTLEPRKGQLPGVSVLVVEDDLPSARLMSILLSNEGCDVRVVGSAEEALALLPAFPAQIAVLDLVLPRMSGLLLAQKLKTARSTRDIVLLAVSFADELHIERVAREVGCAAYLCKPIDGGTLVQTMARLLAKGRRQEASTSSPNSSD